MPWTCPTCGTQIRHGWNEDLPRAGYHYRCYICRLELVLDVSTNTLTVLPLDDHDGVSSSAKPGRKP